MTILVFLLAMGVGDSPDAPLSCPTTVAAKGNVKGGPPLLHTFELTHRGPGILTITEVKAGCGCLRQALTTRVLSPGETARLTLEVNTLTQPDGRNRWPIVVTYKVESPGTPGQTGTLLLQITANLSREVTITPPQFGFSTTGGASQVLIVKDQRSRPLSVVKSTTTSSHLAVEIGTRESGKGQSVTVRLSPSAPVGNRDEFIVLLTDDPEYPELRIPVRVQKRAQQDIRVAPESVVMRFAPGQNELSTLVQLRATDGKPIEVSNVESDVPGVTVRAGSGTGTIGVIRVTVTETAAAQSGSCKVRVRLAQPAGEVLVIPVAWTRAMK
jgi:hypothetical protein